MLQPRLSASAATLEQAFDIMAAEALDDGQPLGHGEDWNQRTRSVPTTFADIGDDGGAEIVAVELEYGTSSSPMKHGHGAKACRVFHSHGELDGDSLALIIV
jgi:hypothetical protein